MMKRRGFILNSAVIALLIPLLLLLATYEDVSSQIINAQSERGHLERTQYLLNTLDIEFQKALELSGKRAVVAAVDYVAVTGNFINPAYGANNTIRDLILNGTSPSITGYNLSRVMGGQTLRSWLSNFSKMLNEEGYILKPSVDSILKSVEIRVAPLDAFTIVIKARIPKVNITDNLGKIVYSGPIPSNGGYVYSTVDIRNLEDPLFSAMTGGRYQRSIRSCPLAYPELGLDPVLYANGSGASTVGHVVGNFEKFPQLSSDLGYNLTHVWDQNGDYLTNFTIDGVPVTTNSFIQANGDIGVMVFSNVSPSGSTLNWCYPSLKNRVNFTISGGSLTSYEGYQIPIVITNPDILSRTYYTGNNASIRIVERGTCNQVPFWIEYWSSTKAIVWIKATASKEYTLYFGNDTTYATRGNGTSVFEWFHGTEEIIRDGGDKSFNLSSLDLRGSIAIDFRAKPSKRNLNQAWESGIVVETTDTSGNPQWVYFIDDTKSLSYSLAVWDVYYVWWWPWPLQGPTTNDGARGDTDFHTYEAVIKPNINGAYVNFLDYGVDYSGFPTPVRQNLDGYLRHYRPPLKYLYLVNLYNRNRNNAIFKWIFIRKYIQTLPTVTFGKIEKYSPPTNTNPQRSTAGRVYDLQLLINCLMDQRYIATRNGWSFFERLEGSNRNHLAYERLANKTQDEMGYTYDGRHYPIGLVSFMIPDPNYDPKLYDLFETLGLSIEGNESSVDYYFLEYYFKGGRKVTGYRVWGISEGVLSTADLGKIPFFLDPATAREIFGKVGTCDLLYGYTCH